VSVLFVDVVGSTRIAARERPQRVVELLNDFFALVVAVVERNGGFVNKFEGDAALCLFGAPVEQPDHAARALACARELHAELERHDGLRAAIGVSCGEAVAGWVGAESRFEYTVIGDPVNEASRLTELAKEQPGRVVVSAAVIEAAGGGEARHWRRQGARVLRGRDRPTEFAALAAASAETVAAVPVLAGADRVEGERDGDHPRDGEQRAAGDDRPVAAAHQEDGDAGAREQARDDGGGA
jgi:adenylate cyclase